MPKSMNRTDNNVRATKYVAADNANNKQEEYRHGWIGAPKYGGRQY